MIRNGLNICMGTTTRNLIFYGDEEIHHVEFWSGDLARHNRSNKINDTSTNFSQAMKFCYSHLFGRCHTDLKCSVTISKCCDVGASLPPWRSEDY